MTRNDIHLATRQYSVSSTAIGQTSHPFSAVGSGWPPKRQVSLISVYGISLQNRVDECCECTQKVLNSLHAQPSYLLGQGDIVVEYHRGHQLTHRGMHRWQK